LIQKYNEIIRKKAIYTQFRNIFDNRRNLKVFNSLGYDLMDHLDIILDLKKGEERLWMEIHKNRRKEIMKGIKKGLVVKLIDIHDNNSLESIYHIIYILYKRIGLPLPSFSFFQNAVNILQPTGFLKTFIAYVENEIVGFRMVLTYNSTIYDWYAASNSEFLTYRPNDVLPWEILKWGCNNKFSIFDFGGAGKHGISYGVRNYKERFGGTIVNYGRYQQVHQRLLMNFSKNLFHIYKLYKSRI
jgi:lipid II:glycine glycyltransferase (peptidoglycan interpeptide bridge formation enzyme)